MRPVPMVLALTVLLSAAALPARAQERTALSPAAESAIKNLSAPEFATREKAVKDLQLAIAGQLKTLASVDDAEAQQRMVVVLEFQDNLTRWAIDMLRLPEKQGAAMLAWGLKPEILPHIANVYAPAPEKRADGIKAIGQLKDDQASWFLVRLIADDRRDVSRAAIDAVRDRPPTAEIVAALWQRSIDPLSRLRANTVVNARRLVATDAASAATDSELATDILVRFKTPLVSEKIKTFIAELNKDTDRFSTLGGLLVPFSDNSRNFIRLVETYKPPEATAFLVILINREVSSSQQITVAGQTVFVSNRTLPLLSLITLTGQKHGDYGLVSANIAWSAPWCAASEADETAAIAKFKTWYAEHKDAIKPAATQPAK